MCSTRSETLLLVEDGFGNLNFIFEKEPHILIGQLRTYSIFMLHCRKFIILH